MGGEMSRKISTNSDVVSIEVCIPEGHRHLRTTIAFRDGGELVLQEATVANLLRAFVAVKTHPQRTTCRLVGRKIDEKERKDGFASWQLLEEP